MRIPDRVLIGYLHPGDVAGPFHESLLHLMVEDAKRGDGYVAGRIAITSGPRVASSRNKLVQEFLTHDDEPDWLWMLDSDMTFPADTLQRLLFHADPESAPILGALCFGGRGVNVFPTLYRLIEPTHGKAIETIWEYPKNALVKVDATGAACLLVHRSVLQRMYKDFPAPQHWFSESVYKGVEFGEDWTFCLRAQQIGYPIHVHTGIKCGHVKPRIVDEDEYERSRM